MSDEETQPEEQTQQENEPETEHKQETGEERQAPQIVTITTPLDRPEFEPILELYMDRLHLTDKKQAAITLSKMMYDMGLDPYSDLTDVKNAMNEMQNLLQHIPDTPSGRRVKDTLAAGVAARAGRTILDTFHGPSGDPMMDRMDRMMDKYVPMVQTFKMIREMFQDPEPRTDRRQETGLSEAVKGQFDEMRHEVSELKQLLAEQAAEKKEKALADTITTNITGQIMPRLQALEGQVSNIASQPPPAPTPPGYTDRLEEISRDIKGVVDKIGEKAGAKSLTLDDLDPLLTIIDKLEKKFKPSESGEFDWKTTAINTVGEVGKELVTAVREVQTAKATASAGALQSPAAPETEVDKVVRRQVQNYILKKLEAGEQQMNIGDAAKALGLTPQQVAKAYNTLVQEGWIQARSAAPQPAQQGPTPPAAPTGENQNERNTRPDQIPAERQTQQGLTET